MHLELHHQPLKALMPYKANLACLSKTACNNRRRLHVLWHCLLKEWDTH